jgi:peptidoglycan/LPS O-acetylase OafA/YrhL
VSDTETSPQYVGTVAAAPVLQAQKRFYRPELDVLRFGAFGFVFLAHAIPYPPGLPPAVITLLGGVSEGLGFGVDLFFLLSSYLITELLLREYRSDNSINVKAFWIRRILRIWPLYFVFLASAIWLVPYVLPQNFPLLHRIAYALFCGNFALMVHPHILAVAGILWSVSIEEQFYLLWPLVMSRYIRNLKWIAVGLILVSSLTRIVLSAVGVTELWLFWANTPARLDPIAAGALLALFLNGSTPRFSQLTRVTALASGVCLMVSCGVFFSRTGWSALAGYPLATIACLLLLLSFLGAPWHFPKVAIYLGRISYGLYVFHAFALRFVSQYLRLPLPGAALSLVRFSAALLLTILLASISYRWLETPFLKLKTRFTVIQSH